MADRVDRVNIKVESLERIIGLLEDGNIQDAIGLLRFACRVDLRREMREKQRKLYLAMRTAYRRKQIEQAHEYEAQLKAYEQFFL